MASTRPGQHSTDNRGSTKPRTHKGCGNDGPWKAWKTKNRFSTLSTALGNRSAIPTFPHPRRTEVNLIPNSRLPTSLHLPYSPSHSPQNPLKNTHTDRPYY